MPYNKDMEKYEWMLQAPKTNQQAPEEQYYGDLTLLNTDRTILDTVGKETLKKIAKDSIDLLETSVAVYEKNGDYAMGIFTSGWCRMMDAASRRLCVSCSNSQALESGKWICHESCWNFSKRALESGEIVDEKCDGGIHIYAIPIFSENQTIGVLSVGYGNPPEDDKTLKKLAKEYNIPLEEIRQNAMAYQKRPLYIEEMAKNRMRSSAELIGLIYQNRKEEQALKETQRNYELAVEATELGTWRWNIQTGESTIDEHWAKMIGYEWEELQPFTFEKWKQLLHPDDIERCLYKINEHQFSKDERYACLFRMKHKQGHWIWVQDKGKVFERTPDGKPLIMYGTHQDITKTKEANEELERFFSLNLNLLGIADMEGNFLKLNKAWEDLLGYQVEELQKRKIFDFIHPDDIESTLKAVSELDKQKSVTNFINRYRTKDGNYHYLEWYAKPYGKRMYAAAHDITQKILDEQALRENREKYRLMIKNSPVGIFSFDENGVLTEVNDSFVHIIGSTRKALIGLNMLKLPDKSLVNAVKRALSGQQGYYNDEYHAVTSEKKVHVRGVFSSITDDEGRFVSGIGIIEDISDQKMAEKALIKAKEEAQAANHAKSDFLASMSHEIRTPINGVIGFSDLLKSTPLNDTQKEYNDIVRQSANSLLSIINDILDFSKIEAGKFKLQYEKTNLYDTIDSALNLLNYKALEKNIDLMQSISRNVPEYVETDPLRLRQILLNLLSNAVKFTEQGEVELIIRKISEKPYSNLVTLYFAVQDTGIGIKEEHLHKILEPFNQGDNINANKFEGTGLGLAITKGLLEKMGSRLKVESTFGKGSTFSFELELKYHQAKPKEVPIMNEKTGTEAEHPPFDTAGKTVLIVEDNKINMQYLETVLKAENKSLDVINAYDGEQALEVFEQHHPNLILMDIQLPKMNGYEVTKRIRSLDQNVPIIAITARALKGEREKCLEAGMNDYHPKPVSISAIKTLLKKYL